MGKFSITNILAYEVLDSRGYPTVACDVYLKKNIKAKSMVPSGASTGEKEAIELRDGDKNRFNGKGVLKAISNINDIIAPALIGKDSRKQSMIDNLMNQLDGTENKAKLGANAILAVSLSVAKAAAIASKKPLYRYISEDILKEGITSSYIMPVPMLNVINGGAHADNTIDFQEFMFMPVGAKTFKQACQIASECFHSLQDILAEKKFDTNKGDEGGFAPRLKDANQALTLMTDAIKKAGYNASTKSVAIALDPAASEMYDPKSRTYIFSKAIKAKMLLKSKGTFTSNDMVKYWESLVKKFPIISIEDGLSEKDWDGFVELNKKIGKHVQIVGDDLYCTNSKILEIGIEKKATNSVLIKLNQIGTLSETIETIQMAQKNGWSAIVSHRSGETEDTTIADLAVALNTGQIKTGSMSRSERISKYNRLIEIENELGDKAIYKGDKVFANLGK